MHLRLVVTTLLALVLAAAPSSARSGAVIVVNGDGTADFTTITAALGVAVNGDIILVEGGVDTESVVLGNTGVHIVGEDGEYPKVASMRVLNQPLSGEILIRGLEIGPKPVGAAGAGALEVIGCDGDVLIEDCLIRGAPGQDSAFDLQGGPALSVGGSSVVLVTRSTLTGGDAASLTSAGFPGISPVGIGGSALNVLSSTVRVFASTLIGGQGGPVHFTGNFGGGSGGSAVSGFDSLVWLEGGLAQGGVGGDGCAQAADGCAGGTAVALASPVPFFDDGMLRHRDAQIVGGLGGALDPPSAGTGDPGATIDADAIAFPGGATYTIDAGPLRDGEPGKLTVVGAPGATAGWMMAFEIQVLELNGAKGAFALNLPFFGPYLMGTLPASGQLDFDFISPSVAATGFEGVTLVKQGIVVDSDGLRFAGPSMFVTLGTTP